MTIVTNKDTLTIDMNAIVANKNIQSVLFSKSRRSILSLLYSHSEDSFYLRQIVRATGLGLGPIQRELKQLTQVGIIRRKVAGKHVYFQANAESPVYSELKGLVGHFNRIEKPSSHTSVPQNKIDIFCRKHHIRKLSLFGSVLRDDFGADSDVDVLVEFEKGCVPGFGIVAMEKELSEIIGRKVDLRTPNDLSKYFREQVVREAKVQYEVDRS